MSERTDDAALLGLLPEHHPVQFASFELARELDWPAFRVADALARLRRAGLVHQRNQFTFAARAAVHCRALGF